MVKDQYKEIEDNMEVRESREEENDIKSHPDLSERMLQEPYIPSKEHTL